MSSLYNTVVVGGGIVGLATALNILRKRPGTKVLVLEKESDIAKHQTGNNSGVIHSGIYYKPGSLKAKNCVGGYHRLLEFADEHGVAYEICGKLIVAKADSEIPYLDDLQRRGEANGLRNLKRLRREEIKEYEPHAAGVAALLVPQTGIIDYTAVSRAYADAIRNSGGEIRTSHTVINLQRSGSEVITETDKGTFTSRTFVSCAGLHSDRIARMTNRNINVRIIPFRGEYYTLRTEKRHLVKNLIYPVPDPAFPFLGVHLTRMVDGTVEAGPNAVFAFKREGYRKTDISLSDSIESIAWKGFRTVIRRYWKTGLGEYYRSFSKRAFVKAIQLLVPDIQFDDLERDGAGVRAQACERDGGLADDFIFIDNGSVLHVCNAPSPAATASLAIGDTLADKILSQFPSDAIGSTK